MPKARELIRLAQDCYARARAAISPETKRALVQQGDNYLKEADELKPRRSVVQAAFPKSDRKLS